MNWKITIALADGTIDTLYCVTREEARNRARFLRLYTDTTHPRAVVATKIERV